MNDILTTHNIAVLCGVDIGTVINWIDSGKLPAFKTPGGHRRVRRDEFVRFLKDYHLPIPRGLSALGHLVLVVDDDEEIRELIVQVLRAKWPEMTVLEAGDGFTAGKLIAEKHPSIIILDVRLPGMDGTDVCRKIRADRRLRNTRIIAITAYHSDEVKRELVTAGADGYVVKPFTHEDLYRVVDPFLV